MPKFTEDNITRMCVWVEQNGLQDFGGATIADLCRYIGIDRATFYAWMNDPTFSTRIKNAKAVFAETAEKRLVDSLFSVALGAETEKQHIEEYTDASGNKKVKKTIDKQKLPPNVGANCFLLKNLNPEKWQDRQFIKSDVNADVRAEAKVETRYDLSALSDEEIFRLADKMQAQEHNRIIAEKKQGE